MLLRVSTKKLRFRNRVRDFYPPAFGAETLSPVTMSVSEESLSGRPQKTHLQTTFNACCAGILPMSFLPKRGAPRGDVVSY